MLPTFSCEVQRDKAIYHFTTKIFDGIMAEIVKIDRSGRIVIPKGIRRELGINKEDQLLLSAQGKDQLLLQKFDVESLVKGLREELAGKDIDAIVRTVRKEINAKIKALYPNLFT
jgi:AbrB family looped-hinge helix DNA binding protein